MIVWTLDAKRDHFRPKEDEEEILKPEVPYLSAIGALLYLAQCTRPTSHSLLIFLQDTTMHLHVDTGMVLKSFFATSRVRRIWACSTPMNPREELPYVLWLILTSLVMQMQVTCPTHKACSQTSYVFTVGVTTISWRSTK